MGPSLPPIGSKYGVAGDSDSILSVQSSRDFMACRGHDFIPDNANQFCRNTVCLVGISRDFSGDTQPRSPYGVVELVESVGTDDLRYARLHRLTRRADSTVMDDRGTAREKPGEGDAVEMPDPGW